MLRFRVRSPERNPYITYNGTRRNRRVSPPCLRDSWHASYANFENLVLRSAVALINDLRSTGYTPRAQVPEPRTVTCEVNQFAGTDYVHDHKTLSFTPAGIVTLRYSIC